MSGEHERDASRVPPTFWALLVLVLFAGLGGGLFTGRGSLTALFALFTVGALLAGRSARASAVLGGAGGALIALPLVIILLRGLGDGDDTGILVTAGFSAVVACAFSAIGWYMAAPERTRGQSAAALTAAILLGVFVALVGIVGLFALACEGGC